MKIIGISGSPRQKNTDYMLKTVLEATGQPYEIIRLSDKEINPCKACKACHKTFKCNIDDDMQELYLKLNKAKFLLLGSPTYFNNVTRIMKNFIDRCLPYWFSKSLEGKKGAILSVGNFKECLEFDKKGKCIWHKEEKDSVNGCLTALKGFCEHIGVNVIDSLYALHGNPESIKDELNDLGVKIAKEATDV